MRPDALGPAATKRKQIFSFTLLLRAFSKLGTRSSERMPVSFCDALSPFLSTLASFLFPSLLASFLPPPFLPRSALSLVLPSFYSLKASLCIQCVLIISIPLSVIFDCVFISKSVCLEIYSHIFNFPFIDIIFGEMEKSRIYHSVNWYAKKHND